MLIMEYFMWDKHYSFPHFVDLKFDKSMRAVAYSGAPNLSD